MHYAQSCYCRCQKLHFRWRSARSLPHGSGRQLEKNHNSLCCSLLRKTYCDPIGPIFVVKCICDIAQPSRFRKLIRDVGGLTRSHGMGDICQLLMRINMSACYLSRIDGSVDKGAAVSTRPHWRSQVLSKPPKAWGDIYLDNLFQLICRLQRKAYVPKLLSLQYWVLIIHLINLDIEMIFSTSGPGALRIYFANVD